MTMRIDPNSVETILFVSLSGIGNAIMLSPSFAAIKRQWPEKKIYLLTRLHSVASLYERLHIFQEIFVIPSISPGTLRTLISLRNRRFDIMITGFPSNRMEYNIISGMVWAKNRLSHSYDGFTWKTGNWVNNRRIPVTDDIHDVEQNMRLLSILEGIDTEKSVRKPFVDIDEKSEEKAETFIRNTGGHVPRIGIHVSVKSSGIASRAGTAKGKHEMLVYEKVACVLCRVQRQCGASVGFFVFLGEDERELFTVFMNAVKNVDEKIIPNIVPVFNKPIRMVAGLLKRMDAVFNLDSGIGHLAAAVGTRVITRMGHTSPLRTRPWGSTVTVLTPGLPCFPCKTYPFHGTNPVVRCRRNFECLHILDAEKISEHIINNV